MKYFLSAISLVFILSVNAQESYAKMTTKALNIMHKSKDSVGYKNALNLYEEAFKEFPDSIDATGLYKASVLANKLKDNDKAFHYLTPLSEMLVDEYGYPGWSYVINDDNSNYEEYSNLWKDTRWKRLREKAIIHKKIFFKSLKHLEEEFFKVKGIHVNQKASAKELYKQLKNYNPYLPKNQHDYSITFKINDTTTTSYLVHLPKNYNLNKRYAMLIFLHGAVRYAHLSYFQVAKGDLEGWNRYYTKYATLNNVILVFPGGGRKYNWMFPDSGFFMVPKIVKQIKKTINIDDNKIFISGHSNGSTGSFSYAMKEPSQFAGFYGFNTYPKVFTGGTFIENALNSSFINFSTDQDYYYPPNANNSLDSLMKSINADYKDYRYNGFPHWFPEFDQSEPAYKILFSDLIKRERNPFPKNITWEFDDNKYGNINWLTNIKLDTTVAKASWYKQPLNFKIKKWLEYNKNDSLVKVDVNKKAFDFPRKSGKLIAEYRNNIFLIKTSRIKSLDINISPEMVNLEKKIKVYINGKLLFNQRLGYNKEFMLKSFNQTRDRKQIWINQIKLDVKKH